MLNVLACSPVDPAAGVEPDNALPDAKQYVEWGRPAVGLAGKCLDVRGGAFANGTPLILWDCHGGDNQKWLLTDKGTLMGIYSKCATVKDNNPHNGTPIVMSDCIHGLASQQWKRTASGQLQGLGGRCMDVSGGNSASGTSIILWDCHGGDNQKWSVEEAPRGNPPSDFCWRMQYDRGAGAVPDHCGADQERSGAVCYPKCASGYSGVADRCYQNCPAGYTDDGATCRRDALVVSADNSHCPSYDLCGLTLAKGCSVCPSGFINDGCTCRSDAHIFSKQSYYRGAGSPLQCASWLDEDAGLCYAQCANGYDGTATVCHGPCPPNLPTRCGTICAASQDACNNTVAQMVVGSVLAVGAVIVNLDFSQVVEQTQEFIRPICLMP